MANEASPDERAIYSALKNVFEGQKAQIRRQGKINTLIYQHQTQPAIAKLIREYGFNVVSNTTKQLLTTSVFESAQIAGERFASFSTTTGSGSRMTSKMVTPKLVSQFSLLSPKDEIEGEDEIMGTPVFTESVRQYGGSLPCNSFAQYGLLGANANKMSQIPTDSLVPAKDDPRIYYNISTPSSVFICGSQGSGKSHTLSCLLENCLLASEANVLPHALTGVVFHYDMFISDTGGSPCEAAYLASHQGVKVRVLCPPTNVGQIKRAYSCFPSVDVEELRLSESDLNTKRMLDLMAVSSVQGGGMPLYLHVVKRILRDLRIAQQATTGGFSYSGFKRALAKEKLSPSQLNPLQQRLDTLESFMVKLQVEKTGPSSKKKGSTKASESKAVDWSPHPGQLTVIDLSCPCVTPETACALFNICTSLFLEQKSSVGRVIALDEAHKYMTDAAECAVLTETLLSTIRLQRHLGTRVIISTQEPTISPKLLDLCSITIVHRFTSPNWLQTLKQHLAGAKVRHQAAKHAEGSDHLYCDSQGDNSASSLTSDLGMELFSKIVSLHTGEALMFAPNAIIEAQNCDFHQSESGLGANARLIRLGCEFMKIRVRKRITKDGGRTMMAF
ncbi:hypothetical protein CDD83_10202 [Cordyceps sp. RAO-2017]|nr:hypothetical protein CDD83_10202 [Cordyceps sp. RAO-2017]